MTLVRVAVGGRSGGSTADFLSWVILCLRGHPVHSLILTSFGPQDEPIPHCQAPNCPQMLTNAGERFTTGIVRRQVLHPPTVLLLLSGESWATLELSRRDRGGIGKAHQRILETHLGGIQGRGAQQSHRNRKPGFPVSLQSAATPGNCQGSISDKVKANLN